MHDQPLTTFLQSPLFRYSLSLLENLAHQQDKHSVHITYYYVFTLAIM
jgi:hypothetical protein